MAPGMPTPPPPDETTADVAASSSLSGWRVLVTRPTDQAQTFARALSQAGAVPVVYPTIELGPPPSWGPLDAALARIDTGAYGWLVFTSPSAVTFALDHAPTLARALATPGAPRVAAVGSETARALRERGVPVALVPEDQRQEGLVAGLVAGFGALAAGTRILFPQAIGGRELLREQLEARGAVVEVVPVSETRARPLPDAPPPFDVATFASPSALRAFVAGRTAAALVGKVVAVIGPTTRDAALAAGVTVDVVPRAPSVAALIQALAAHRAAHDGRPPRVDEGDGGTPNRGK